MANAITMNENGTDRKYEDYPAAVTIQYFSKEGQPLNVPIRNEFYTLASFLLWVIAETHNFIFASKAYSDFAYFAATRPYNEPVLLETEYVKRSYTFTK